MTIASKVAGSVCDAMPVNQPGKSTVIDKISNVLITAFIVGDVPTGN